MIVNPQLFNYRLIIGSLLVAIATLSVFSYTQFQSIKTEQEFLAQEKRLVENELFQMFKRYDEVAEKNTLFSAQFDKVKKDAENAQESLKFAQSELALISKVKNQVYVLQSKNHLLLKDITMANSKYAELQREKTEAFDALQQQRDLNHSIVEENKNLKAAIEKASVLTVNAISAVALNKTLGKTVLTTKASKTESIEVSITLAENMFVEIGDKDLYVQILTPENNVFADKGAINFGESSLIYSSKKTVAYNNKMVNVSIAINAEDDDQPLTEGNYFITVFNRDKKLGSTQLQLN